MNFPKRIADEIDALSESGNVLSDADDFEGAIVKWKTALQLLPEPRADWDAYAWLMASIGDAQYQLSRWEDARESFYDALNAEDGRGNPFIHYRLGQCLIKTGDEQNGLESLLKAYMLDGEDIFNAGDPDGPMYLQKLRDVKLID